ncbi:MAG: hypothetical protein Q4D56_08575 [Bacteroides sp.]|nr:hypothetical protein [Bacteroides sp.]
MKYNTLLLFVLAIALLTSCSTMRKSTSTTLEVSSGIYQYPTVADLQVLPKVEKEVTWNFVPFNWGQPSLDLRKQNMIADIVKENQADVFLEPQISYTKRPFGERTLVITGYPAKFKNFRKANGDDLRALEVIVPAPKMKVYNVSRPWYKKIFPKKKGNL